MDDQVFKLLMERFDNLEQGQADIQACITTHCEADAKIHAIVARHGDYFKFLKYIGATTTGAGVLALLTKLGLK